MSKDKSSDDLHEQTDRGSQKQSDAPWKQPVEKEQGSGTAKPDIEKWKETNTH